VILYLQDFMVAEGLAWVDDQAQSDRLYWFPGLFTENMATIAS
jgi:hypothetical protein